MYKNRHLRLILKEQQLTKRENMATNKDLFDQTNAKIGAYVEASPKMMTAFMELHHLGAEDGALKSKHKELIALGISIHTKCEGCILSHVHDALKAGASHDEIVETIDVAVYMGGGPCVIYGSKAFAILQEFEKENA